MKRFLIFLMVVYTSLISLFAQGNTDGRNSVYSMIDTCTGWYNLEETFYKHIRINGHQLSRTISEDIFNSAMGGAPDSICVKYGDFLYFDRTLSQNNKEVSPINVVPVRKKDVIVQSSLINRQTGENGITMLCFSLNTPNFIFNEKIRVGDHIDKLQELGGSCYTLKEFDEYRGGGVILWYPSSKFPEYEKYEGAEVPEFHFNQNGIITKIIFWQHGA